MLLHYHKVITYSNGTKLAMRAYHPLLTTESWKSLRPEIAETVVEVGNIDLLEVGETLVEYEENTSIVSVEERAEIDNYKTYNLSVEEYHNYIVDGFVAHNASCPN